MDDLININIQFVNKYFVVDSREVAKNFDKRHDNVLRDIENIKKDVLNFEEMFLETKLPDSYGRSQRAYYMNRDGFSLLAMGFTGKAALEWKMKYIIAFNAMERAWNSPEQVMARALKMADKTITGLQADVERMKPKVLSVTGRVIGTAYEIIKADIKVIGYCNENFKRWGPFSLFK